MARPANKVHPWMMYHGRRYVGARATRQVAMNALGKESTTRFGFARISHRATGEAWERRRGSWFKVSDGEAPAR